MKAVRDFAEMRAEGGKHSDDGSESYLSDSDSASVSAPSSGHDTSASRSATSAACPAFKPFACHCCPAEASSAPYSWNLRKISPVCIKNLPHMTWCGKDWHSGHAGVRAI